MVVNSQNAATIMLRLLVLNIVLDVQALGRDYFDLTRVDATWDIGSDRGFSLAGRTPDQRLYNVNTSFDADYVCMSNHGIRFKGCSVFPVSDNQAFFWCCDMSKDSVYVHMHYPEDVQEMQTRALEALRTREEKPWEPGPYFVVCTSPVVLRIMTERYLLHRNLEELRERPLCIPQDTGTQYLDAPIMDSTEPLRVQLEEPNLICQNLKIPSAEACAQISPLQRFAQAARKMQRNAKPCVYRGDQLLQLSLGAKSRPPI